jgi:SsrA-binding protein
MRAYDDMKKSDNTITKNKKAHFDYFIEETMEAGLVLLGWEVKSLREGKVNLSDGYVLLKNHEAFLLGAQIQPLATASKHSLPEPNRTRKLLLHKKELAKLIGAVERSGYTVIPLTLYWKNNCIKLSIGLAKGKKTHDKRESIKSRDWHIKECQNG